MIIPNVGFKVYKNGIEIPVNFVTKTNNIPRQLGDIPAKKYTYQNIGGLTSLLKGSMGNFRFYDRELSSTEISAIGSIGTTTNDLDPFNVTRFFSEANIYNFYGKNTDQNDLLTQISSYGNLYTIGTLSNGSDDRIKSHEVEIQNATNTLLKLSPNIYDKHPFVKFSEDQEDNDLENVAHYKKQV